MAINYEGAVVVGSGPNGLAAAITLQRSGIPVLVIEGRETIGGGMRTAELTLPGYQHDVCSAIYAMAAVSPFFRQLRLEEFGLDWVEPPVLAAHPFDDGEAAGLLNSLETTASLLREDGHIYRRIIGEFLPTLPQLLEDILGPLSVPRHPLMLARFGMKALLPASILARRFQTRNARGLFAGMAAHSMQPFTGLATSAIALVLSLAGHSRGWPMPRGGSQKFADALATYFRSIGGRIETGTFVRSLDELPSDHIILFDTSVSQMQKIAATRLSTGYLRQLSRFRPGPGIFKVDWALDGPAPFTALMCREAGTVHLGGTLEEIEHSELNANRGRISKNPFVLFVQQSIFDKTRAPANAHTAWAYCHVPNGCTVDMTDAIEDQVERFAPGFRDRILQRHVMSPTNFESYNPNYTGGDINGGAMTLMQTFARPVPRLSPYKTSAPELYLCSASTPPGGGVHGQCGYHAARQVLKDHFPELLHSM